MTHSGNTSGVAWSLRFHSCWVLCTSPVHSLKSNTHTLHTERKHARLCQVDKPGFHHKQYDGFHLGKCLGEDEKRIICVLQRHFERCTTLVSFSEPSVQYITGSLAERLAKRLCHSLPPLLPTFLQQTHTEVHYNESLSEEGKLTPAHADESFPYPNGPKLLSHLEAMSHVVLHRESPELSTNTPYTS